MDKPQDISQKDWLLLCQKYKNMNKVALKLNKGYPIQYLIGYVDFYGIKIYVNKHVLIPRYETEYLVSKTINYIKKYFTDNILIVDAGTGSGCIALKLKSTFPNSKVIGFDASSRALRVAKKNAKLSNLHINLIKSSFNKFNKENVDVLISNPPYIASDDIEISPDVVKYEPHMALFARNNGLKYYEQILKNSLKILNSKSMICFEIGYTQAEAIKSLVKKYYPKAKITIEKDLQGKDRYIFILNNI